MSRRKRAVKRDFLPDPKFGDPIVTRFLNQMMYDGKKSVAQGIFYGALDIVAEKYTEDPPLEAFKKALEKVRPALEVKSRRVGGATYQVPVDVRPQRGLALAMRWLIKAARSRNEYYMKTKLANEILDALKGAGSAFKKKEDTHKMADANRAFAHFKW